MELKFICKKCSQKLAIDDDLDVDISCPSCGELISAKDIHSERVTIINRDKLPTKSNKLRIQKTYNSSKPARNIISTASSAKKEIITNNRKTTNFKEYIVYAILALLFVFGIGYTIIDKIFKVRVVDVWAEIENGNTIEIEYYLNNGGDINITDMGNCDMLNNAVTLNEKSIVELLVKKGINLNTIGPDYNNSALSIACENGNYEIAKVLLDAGALYDNKNIDGDTPLIIAIKNKNENYGDIVDLLISKGAKLDKLDNKQTILTDLIIDGEVDLVKKLSANKNLDLDRYNDFGETALLVACVMGDMDIVSCLVGNGASINKISKNQFKHSPISSLLFYKAFEVSSLFEYKNEIDAVADYVGEPGNPNVTPNAMGRGRSSMQMNPYGNPYGMGMMPGMIPGGFSTDGLGYNSGGVKLTNLNGPLSKYPYPGDSSIYSITMENRLNGENVVDLDSQMDILLDFRNSQHFIIYEYLEQKGAKLENKDQELIKILHEPYKYFSIGKNESSNIITKEAATKRKFDETQDPELSADKPLSAREAYRFYWGIVEELHNMKQNSIDSFEGLEERAKRERLTKNEMIKEVKKETSAFVLNQYMELHVLIENQTSNRISRLASLFYCLNASWNEGAAGDYLFVKRKLPKSQEDAYLRIKGFNKFLKGSTLLGIKRTAGYVVSVNKAKAYVKKYPNLQFDWKSNYKIFLSEFPWTFKRELAEIAKKIN